MKNADIHERRQSAARMETVLVSAGFLALVAAVFGFLAHGWPTGLGLILLGLVAFGLARLFELVSGLLAAVARLEAKEGRVDRKPASSPTARKTGAGEPDTDFTGGTCTTSIDETRRVQPTDEGRIPTGP